MSNRAQIATRRAFLWTEFGLSMAGRYFSQEKLSELPRFSRGKNKGQIKGQIEWRKVEKGGWVNEGIYGGDTPVGYVERRVGSVIEVRLMTAEWNSEPTTLATWRKEEVPA